MTALINYHKDDIPYEAARRAHHGTSFTPEKRAEQERTDYVNFMDALANEFVGYATDENRAEIAAELERFRQGYVKRRLAHLHARSRVLSSMITGPANFPVRRNEKANASADRRWQELDSYTKKVLDKLRNRFDPRRLAHAPISSDDPEAIDKLREKVAEAEALQERMKAANRIVRSKADDATKIERLMKELGMNRAKAAGLLTPDFMSRFGYPRYMLSNNNANIRRMKQRIAQLEKEAERAETLAAADDAEPEVINGGTIVENADIARLQIFFDGKPEAAVRQRLKANGFKWAPSQGAWQRLLNNNARWAAKRALEG